MRVKVYLEDVEKFRSVILKNVKYHEDHIEGELVNPNLLDHSFSMT